MPQGIDNLANLAIERPDLEGLRDLLVTLPESLLALGACAVFDSAGRTRRVLFESQGLSVVLCGWLPGQRSEPHDHGGSLCALRVLRGVATEARYEITQDGRAREVERDDYLPGSVLACDGSDVHALINDRGSSEPLVTLHLYRPTPLMTEYDLVPEEAP
ncbi:MAG: cysteine dioxygenase family protein [Phycisphaeraceae bacterium]|nr:cysteine dioxygenase family protein [Phycisphaeraceae bacterium]